MTAATDHPYCPQPLEVAALMGGWITATAPLCGHRWHTRHLCGIHADGPHWCELDAGHAEHAPHLPRPHACRCGATTTREDAR